MTTFDLHMHSMYSKDGEFTCLELIEKAKQAHLNIIALSDHNNAKGVDEMLALGKEHGIRVIPAIEFDTLFEGNETHLLGYNFDYHQPYFDELEEKLNAYRKTSMIERIHKLNDYFQMDLDPEALLVKFGTKNPFPDIVKTFLDDPRYLDKEAFMPYREGGSRANPAAVNFYWDFCSSGNPCYVHVPYPSLEDSVKIIHDAGGIAIIAHPFRTYYHNDALLQKAIEAGIDGIEAYSNYHDAQQNAYYEQFCREHNLLITCGSDFHGKMKPTIKMGEYGYNKNDDGKDIIDAFLNNLDKYAVSK